VCTADAPWCQRHREMPYSAKPHPRSLPQQRGIGMTEKEGISISRGLLEGSDVLNRPIEAGIYDSETDDYLPVAPHWHYYMEIIYVEEGAVLVENDGRNYTVGKGDLIMIRPETIHSILPVTTAHTTYIFTKFDVNCVLAGENSYVPKLGVILRHAAGDPNAPMKLDEERIRSYHFGEHIRRIYDELLAMNYGCDVMARSYLTLLMIKVLRIWRAMGADLDSAIAKDTSDISIHNITAYIDDHVGEDLRVEQLAGLCNMSYSYFAKSFHSLYGRSCKEYIEHIRISKAEELLLFTDCDLAYISQETGFADSSHLIKTFRKLKGITPRQYKLRSQKPALRP
jgi:AraC-like DNA-binding protein/mannose-6-phosphate isomerase-like protein (cupin superfamily)